MLIKDSKHRNRAGMVYSQKEEILFPRITSDDPHRGVMEKPAYCRAASRDRAFVLFVGTTRSAT